MALATLDRSPPPLFRQGTSALNKLLVCAALSVLLMAADTRWGVTAPLRSVLATVLNPVQRALLAPVDAYDELRDRLRGARAAMAAEQAARAQLAQQALVLAQTRTLQLENERLRKQLGLREAVPVPAHAADVLFQAGDLFSQRLIIDRGRADGVRPGAAAIDERGVLGQVTRVHLQSAEVTLLADKEASIPVLNVRTQALMVAFGGEREAGMELRFVAANADINVGDELVTSGLDGVYPPGLPVARVVEVQRRGQTSFARVRAQPHARADGARQVLVLGQMPGVEAAQQEAQSATDRPKTGGRP
ncbi:rod shape-determining protein MreC [Inhella gelatinilytica]|uniref:Cell shape-determining protein MreC n=1 Tax=Inhella gelatinilytica TaxID=2795030 RepID=A0A931ISF8_9BURK|nr:rod shape-determining protein MreC [Inhella gelatinilytica]MBH9551845.1 rod shape-determining protein MreC [Inhella gelatinilytica]